MKNFWLKLIKPRAVYAKWLVFLFLIAIIAMGVTGYFENVKQHLDTDALTLRVGAYKISAYSLLRSLITLILIFWITAAVSEFAEQRIRHMRKVKTATRVLLTKIVQIVLYILAGVIALDLIGIDLTTLTVFSGAVGIGLGFGLQKIASNFISGLILLLEKSVEQDDLIELSDGTFGFVRKASARYTLIETFDTKEVLVPNEDLITDRVINWTLSSKQGRLEVEVGVSYKSDIKLVRELILEAASEHPLCSKMPEPVCYLKEFGDSSVDFLLWFWVDDVTKGRWAPRSEVQFAIWDKFKERGIEIPFPQRDVHLRPAKDVRSLEDGK